MAWVGGQSNGQKTEYRSDRVGCTTMVPAGKCQEGDGCILCDEYSESIRQDKIDEGYSYLVFAYDIGLGPAGEEVPDLDNSRNTGQGYTDIQSKEMDVETWRVLACTQEFTWECGWVLSLILCESTNRPEVVGFGWMGGVKYYFYGLLQVHHPDQPGPTNEYLLQPYLNLVEGHIQYVEWKQGERGNPWPNCP